MKKRLFLSAMLLSCLTACGGGSGAEVTGTYQPMFPPNTPRYEMALTDAKLVFLPGYKVEVTNGRGTNVWDYSVRGGVITMSHADGSKRKDYSVGDGNCLIYRKGDATLELQYC